MRLHYLLLTDEFGCDEAVKEKLPPLPPGPANPTSGGGGVAGVSSSGGTGSNESSYNSSISINSSSNNSVEIAQGLDAYLKALLAIPAVVQSQVFSGFLEKSRRQRRADREEEEEEEERRRGGSAAGWPRDSCSGWDGGGGEARKSPETAIDFLLQPFEYSKVYLPRRAEHTESIDVLRGESVVWKFEVMDHLDIDFSVTFRPQPVVAASPFSPPEAGDGGEFAVDAGGAVRPEASPGPRGIGGEAATAAANNNSRSSEAEGKLSRWWGRGGGGAGCKSAVGAASGEARGEEGGAKEQTRIVHLPTRYATGGGDPVQGSFSCPAAGT